MPDQFPDATKKVLSSAAQAVYNAVLKICPAPTDEIAAAALRAAANQADPRKHVKDIDYVPEMYTDGCHDTIATFLNIADELEGVTYGTYRCELEAR